MGTNAWIHKSYKVWMSVLSYIYINALHVKKKKTAEWKPSQISCIGLLLELFCLWQILGCTCYKCSFDACLMWTTLQCMGMGLVYGSRVSVWEELNTWTSITVMRATWDPTASLLHGHTAITSTAATERERYGGGRRRRKGDGSDLYIWRQAERQSDTKETLWYHWLCFLSSTLGCLLLVFVSEISFKFKHQIMFLSSFFF